VVPWAIAERLKPHQLLAFQVIAGEIRGGEWDWTRMRWKERKR
jgi:hypothetical protein